MSDKPEIPEFQYAGIGKLVCELLKDRKSTEYPATMSIQLLDYGRTLSINVGDRVGEITLRYPVLA
jgi:hypothetical protein